MYTLFTQEKIIHRDLKPENILINEYGRAFIADVGAFKRFEETQIAKSKANISNYAGTTVWMAPEMVQASVAKSSYTIPAYLSKLDIFSLGLITLNAIDKDGYLKYKGKINIDEKLLREYLQEVEDKKLITDGEFLTVLRSMLSFEINSRISIDRLYRWMVIFFL